MPKLKERGVIHLLLPLILLAGILVGVYLITSGNPLKLFSKASNPPIVIQDSNGNPLPQNNGIPYTQSPNLKVILTSTLGGPQGLITTSKPQISKTQVATKKISVQDTVTQTVSLQPGWNAFGLIVAPNVGIGVSAPDLLNYLNNSSVSVLKNGTKVQGGGTLYTRLSKYNGINDNFQTYILGNTSSVNLRNNFPVKQGEGYLLYSTQYSTVTVTGTSLVQSQSIPLSSGGNFISFVYVPDSINTAEKLAQSIKAQKGNVSAIVIWDQGGWNVHLAGQNDTNANLPIKPGVGYTIRMGDMENTFTYTIPGMPSPAPSQPYTVSYKLAENPSDLNTSKVNQGLYNQEPLTLNYTLLDTSVGKHFIWVRFTDSNGKTDDRSQEVDIVNSTPTPSPIFPPLNHTSELKNTMLLYGNSCAVVASPSIAFSNSLAPSVYTIEGWFKPYSLNAVNDIFTTASGSHSYDNNNGLVVDRTPAVIEIGIKNGRLNLTAHSYHYGATTDSSSSYDQIVNITGYTKIQTGQWYDFLVMKSGNQAVLFLNGHEDAPPANFTAVTTTAALDGSLNIGCSADSLLSNNGYYNTGAYNTSNYFNGEIDEMRISNTLRYPQYSYGGSFGYTVWNTPFPFDTNTLALWHFDGWTNIYGKNYIGDETSRNNAAAIGNIQFTNY